MLGVSKDSVKSHEKFKTKYELPFTLLSDPEKKVCEQYGVLVEKMNYGKKYMGVERSTFIIDADGKVAEIYRNVKKIEEHIQAVLDFLAR